MIKTNPISELTKTSNSNKLNKLTKEETLIQSTEVTGAIKPITIQPTTKLTLPIHQPSEKLTLNVQSPPLHNNNINYKTYAQQVLEKTKFYIHRHKLTTQNNNNINDFDTIRSKAMELLERADKLNNDNRKINTEETQQIKQATVQSNENDILQQKYDNLNGEHDKLSGDYKKLNEEHNIALAQLTGTNENRDGTIENE